MTIGYLELNSTSLSEASDDEIRLCTNSIVVTLSIIIYSVCGLLIVCANAVILVNMRHTCDRCYSHMAKFFYQALAFTDMFIGIICCSFEIVFAKIPATITGSILCNVFMAIYVTMVCLSLLLLCCVSIDRYIAITRPLRYPTIVTPKRSRWAVVACGLLSLLPFSLEFLPYTDLDAIARSCTLRWIHIDQTSMSFVAILVILLCGPFSVLIFTNFRLLRIVRKSVRLDVVQRTKKKREVTNISARASMQNGWSGREGSRESIARTVSSNCDDVFSRDERIKNFADDGDIVDTRLGHYTQEASIATGKPAAPNSERCSCASLSSQIDIPIPNVINSEGSSECSRRGPRNPRQPRRKTGGHSRGVRTILMVTFMFLICWSPFVAMLTVKAIVPTHIPCSVIFVVTVFNLSNSFCNAFIFLWMSACFRRKSAAFLRRLFCRRQLNY
ncbi:5-hydroxytryptamine receptor 1A-like [Diadema setosum]|uniref:5-hydroxytryptamine receptor 1A-like n=1 Tax=Diadema setosum TaxID=31175 RepID=UPI003B3B38EA